MCKQNQILCNVHPLYIHLTCNVCPLYIPITCLVCQYDLICKLVLCVMLVPLNIPLTYMFTVHVHTKPVCNTGVHKNSLQYRCTQNQFTVQVYTKSVYSTCIHKTRLEYTF